MAKRKRSSTSSQIRAIMAQRAKIYGRPLRILGEMVMRSIYLEEDERFPVPDLSDSGMIRWDDMDSGDYDPRADEDARMEEDY